MFISRLRTGENWWRSADALASRRDKYIHSLQYQGTYGQTMGDGTASPAAFNPTKLATPQWVEALKEAGFRMTISTTKHDEDFCRWPSKVIGHSVKSSPS